MFTEHDDPKCATKASFCVPNLPNLASKIHTSDKRRRLVSSIRSVVFNYGVSLFPHLVINEQDEGEGDSSPESSVHHDELVDGLELVEAVAVGDGRQQQDAWGKEFTW